MSGGKARCGRYTQGNSCVDDCLGKKETGKEIRDISRYYQIPANVPLT